MTALFEHHVVAWRDWRYDQARRFLQRLDPEADAFTFQCFDDTKAKRKDLARVVHNTFDKVSKGLDGYQDSRAGVFVTVNETDGNGRQAHNVKRIRAVFVDLDGAPIKPVIEAGIAPHIVCESSPGKWHCYWLVDDCPLDQFERVQRALAKRFGGDPSVHDLPRVMRLPGFRHFKGEACTSILHDELCCDAPPYALPEIVGALHLDLNPSKTDQQARQHGVGGMIEPGNRHGHLFASGRAMRNRRLSREAVRAALSAENIARCNPPLPEADIDHLTDRAFTAKDAQTWQASAAHDAGGDNPPPATGEHDTGAAAHQSHEGNAAGCDPDGWPEPLPLPTLPSVPPFDLKLLPDKFAPWVADAAERARFAPDFAAVSAMVAFGSLVGRRLGLRLKAMDDWTEFGNVWGALIGLPSSLKSPAMRDSMSPFKRLQFKADENDAKASLLFDAAFELAKIRNDAAKKAAKNSLAENPDAKLDLVLEALPTAPPSRVYWTSDATVERLGEILVDNPNGVLVERDELSSLLTNLEDERNATARGFYLTGWSGKEGYRFDRIMRGKTAIPAFALSLIGGIQPGPLERYVRGAFSGQRADGLLQRFQLAVWPDAPAFEYVDRWPDKAHKDAAAALFNFADTFDPERIGQHDDFGNSPPFLRLDACAQGLFVEWYTAYMVTRRRREASGEDCAAVSSHFGKYPGLLGKLALILHIADEPAARAVGERTILKALAWLEYLEPHARRIYHGADAPDADTARLLLARIKHGQVQSPFKAREIYRNGWHGLGDAKRTKAACRLLADFDYLRAIESDGPMIGRPSDPLYYVNPRGVQ